uniref:Agenet domain-containing protein n=1 Tax=Opuntia streptacantha TaxID=393608 RepID=A0A7C9B325_OPUST
MNPKSPQSQKMRMQTKIKTKGLENRRQQHHPQLEPTTSTPTQFNFYHQNPPKPPYSLYPVGSQVEVTSDEDGFRGAWFVATVIHPPSFETPASESSSSSLFVEYKNLLAEENGCALLKEFVDVAFVRPKPPVDEEKDISFEVNDVVDAFFQDGWWTGVVTEVVERNSRYKVFFSNPPEELEFGSSDLRVHKNWVDGKWVRPEKEVWMLL